MLFDAHTEIISWLSEFCDFQNRNILIIFQVQTKQKKSMTGIRKILYYDVTLSNEENAKRNNVSLAGINDYIRRNNIDRITH